MPKSWVIIYRKIAIRQGKSIYSCHIQGISPKISFLLWSIYDCLFSWTTCPRVMKIGTLGEKSCRFQIWQSLCFQSNSWLWTFLTPYNSQAGLIFYFCFFTRKSIRSTEFLRQTHSNGTQRLHASEYLKPTYHHNNDDARLQGPMYRKDIFFSGSLMNLQRNPKLNDPTTSSLVSIQSKVSVLQYFNSTCKANLDLRLILDLSDNTERG